MAEAKSQPQLLEEGRNKASFDSNSLGEIIYGSREVLERAIAAFHRVEKALGTDDSSKLPAAYSGMNRQELFLEGLKSGMITFNDDLENDSDTFHHSNHLLAIGNSNPLGLTLILFTPFLKLQGSDEQVAYWLPLAESGKIIGSYAQTELGHGTHVGGIETTATFDRETDEFVINTPTLSSIKYWPGALGFSASHTILMARLIIGRKDYGVHAFMVQLRSLEDFKPIPGVELGDIGLKMSYNGTDNGYAIFKNVRIPRTNLLMRYSKVSRDGTYTAAPLREKLVYGGMLNGRSIIIRGSAFQLAQALTITTRYSTVRLQGDKLSPSTPIITYKHQHMRLLSLISTSYAMIFASQSSSKITSTLSTLQRQGNHTTLPYTHMLMCGLKAWTSQTAADGAEDARKMCGGHGYMAISGLPEIVSSLAATCTFEGENFVMWGQVAHYLVKGMDLAVRPQDMRYVACYCPIPAARPTNVSERDLDLLDHKVLLDIFKQRAASLISEAYRLVKDEERKGRGREMAMDIHSLPLLVAGRAHIEVFILEACIERLSLLPTSTSPAIRTVLTRLVSLFGLTTIASPLSAFSSSFLSSSSVTPSQLRAMRVAIDELLEKLLPDAVALTDAWGFSDGCLRSALGCRDGAVYERIMSWTRQLPINIQAQADGGVFRRGWEDVVDGFLKREKVFRAKL